MEQAGRGLIPVLEYAEMDFNTFIKKRSNLANPMTTALYFWKEMLQIVKVIHNEGVIHNDLKPENFVVLGAQLKLIDFGIANTSCHVLFIHNL